LKAKDIKHFRDLEVSKRAFAAAMRIYEITKSFPIEERSSLIDQMRRSSRSVCSNLAEAWRKRQYNAVFKNTLIDSMREESETLSWLEFSFACKYIQNNVFNATSQLLSFSASLGNSINDSGYIQECSRC
jgi:four helix bundle protein